jgi:hypothetical protein
MLRVCAIVLIAYNCGYPGLKSVRPAVLEQPLVGFHQQVNLLADQTVDATGRAVYQFKVFAANGFARAKHELADVMPGKR